MAIPLRARLFLSSPRSLSRLPLVTLAFAVLGARGASACAVCFVAEEETRVAFLVTTGLLTLMPLAFAGGVVYWLVKRSRELKSAEQAASAPAPQGSQDTCSKVSASARVSTMLSSMEQ